MQPNWLPQKALASPWPASWGGAAFPAILIHLHRARQMDWVELNGVGIGHGIGLCQRGGADMARHGSSFQEILQHYYPNTEVKHY
jgi:SpoIID/LytB domain protein